jgi:hypothetical protein
LGRWNGHSKVTGTVEKARRDMFIKRLIGRYLARLVIMGAISAGAKAFKNVKKGGAPRKRILKVVGKS